MCMPAACRVLDIRSLTKEIGHYVLWVYYYLPDLFWKRRRGIPIIKLVAGPLDRAKQAREHEPLRIYLYVIRPGEKPVERRPGEATYILMKKGDGT